MKFHHVVFDPEVLADAFFDHPERGPAARDLVEKVLNRELTGWIPAQCLPAIEARIRSGAERTGSGPQEAGRRSAEYLEWVCRNFRILTLPGQESKELVARAVRLEEAQIALAASALGSEACVATSREGFDTQGAVEACSPADLIGSAPAPRPGRIDLVDLGEQQRRLLPGLERRVRSVLRQGRFIMGPEIPELEKGLAEYVGVRHALCCASGTDALLLGLLAFGVGPGDAVLTSPFTFIATAEVIALVGATPVFVDIDPRTFNLDPACLDKALAALRRNDPAVYPLPRAAPHAKLRAKGIIPVDLFGQPADYDSIGRLAREHDLFVLEDAAQSFGGDYRGHRAGSLGHVGATSFFPSKPLGCYGDAGAVFTDDDELAGKMSSLRVHGQGSNKYDNIRIGLNARCDTLQAAVLLSKLEAFPEEIRARQEIARAYTRHLSACPSVRTPFVAAGIRSAWAQYSLLSDNQASIRKILADRGVSTAVYYPRPLHLQPAFSGSGYREGDFPVSEDAARRIFSLPMHPYLSEEKIRYVADLVTKAADSGSPIEEESRG
ncbi:MAG: DegT/DnrJ/EryC1/StrS family aminotransferase [bacterium]